ncbi:MULTISPECIES: LysR family transcriptional regulator [unclassified Mesorhizobium]|uniref:LysR family transcriptional regulator n=1 Tax=unclassified Mesorhizobium TaxID=325217 RepID=UPI0024154A62|nr:MULTISPECIES: LysR family transcriptional regulator [unclassified Mesorhizobium]MDG4889889.1 LysR family transcriptional regulator [Mesorhizobium sp. WSM4887]MDG4904032.1 LysR family transcriptional regulator [Mesorhizobium sp. WSM4962]MDG4909059.1 LysR family transcriptional regulator [Mesorhizobium sp. WSM4898]MDG4921683.1 LysR family transcriptional regulator [Mesorhizobium sp. WSM4989]
MIRSTTRQSLDYFFRVAQLGSIRAASEHLRIAPSAVSRKVAQLEYEFGVELIIRQARGIKLTEAGQYVYRYLQESRVRDALLYETISELQGLKRGSVTIAAGSGFVEGLIAPTLTNFLQKYPDIQIEILAGNADEIINTVIEDEADIGIVFGTISEVGIEVVYAIEQPLRLIVSTNHPLATRETVDLRSICDLPLALPPLTAGIRQAVTRAFREAELELSPSLTVGPVQGLVQYAASGVGATFLPEFSCKAEVLRGMVRAIPIEDDIVMRTRTSMFIRHERHLPPAAKALLAALELAFPFTA